MSRRRRMIHIFHVLNSLNVGGLENGVVNLVNRMDHGRFRHTLCCIRGSGPMAARISRGDVEVINLSVRGRDRLLVLKMAGLLRRIRPDIVHTRNFGTIEGIPAARLALVRSVIHGEHGWEFHNPAGVNIKQNLARNVLLRGVRAVVAVSGDIRRWLVRTVGVSPGKIRTIINGVDMDRFAPSNNRAAARGSVGLPESGPMIGTVGRLDRIKNYDMLLSAAHEVQQKGTFFRLVFVGEGPERAALEARAAALGLKNVFFTGRQGDVPGFLNAWDLFVLPSISEGISNTILEAMAAGLHVVATNVGGNPELIENGKSGTLVPSSDVGALAEALKRILSSPDENRKIGARARQRCRERFSLDRMVRDYEELYLSVV